MTVHVLNRQLSLPELSHFLSSSFLVAKARRANVFNNQISRACEGKTKQLLKGGGGKRKRRGRRRRRVRRRRKTRRSGSNSSVGFLVLGCVNHILDLAKVWGECRGKPQTQPDLV